MKQHKFKSRKYLCIFLIYVIFYPTQSSITIKVLPEDLQKQKALQQKAGLTLPARTISLNTPTSLAILP